MVASSGCSSSGHQWIWLYLFLRAVPVSLGRFSEAISLRYSVGWFTPNLPSVFRWNFFWSSYGRRLLSIPDNNGLGTSNYWDFYYLDNNNILATHHITRHCPGFWQWFAFCASGCFSFGPPSQEKSTCSGPCSFCAPMGGLIFPIVRALFSNTSTLADHSQLMRQLEESLSYGWIIRIMGFIILFNTGLVLVLARPRVAVTRKRAFIEWSAFKEIPYTLFIAGILFTLWGSYIAYFYVSVNRCLRPQHLGS